MSSTSIFSNKKPLCWPIKIFFCRAKKKYYGIVEGNRLSRDFITQCHASGFEIFSLKSRQNMTEFEILIKTISPSEDEEVWLYSTPNSPS